jgi:hypothetical protein
MSSDYNDYINREYEGLDIEGSDWELDEDAFELDIEDNED